MLVGERVEGVVDEFAQRLRPFDLLQLFHPVRVIHPLRLQLGHLLALGPVELRPEDRHRVLQDRLDQGEDVECVGVARRIEPRERVEQPEREGVVDGKVGLQMLRHLEVRREVLVPAHLLDEPGGAQPPAGRRRGPQVDPLVALVPVGTPHHLHETRIALRARRIAGAGLRLRAEQTFLKPPQLVAAWVSAHVRTSRRRRGYACNAAAAEQLAKRGVIPGES